MDLSPRSAYVMQHQQKMQYVNPAELHPYPLPPFQDAFATRHKPKRSMSEGELGSVIAQARRERQAEATTLTLPLPRGNANAGAFVFKLYSMLEDPSCQHLINFSPHGKSFVVSNATEFSKEVLHKHFKHNNFSSFVRQCNMYGFHKVNKTPRGQRGTIEAQSWEFSHPKFIKGRVDLLESIKRKAMDDSFVNTSGPLTPPPTSSLPSWSPLSSPNPSPAQVEQTEQSLPDVPQMGPALQSAQPSPMPSMPPSPRLEAPVQMDDLTLHVAALQRQLNHMQDALMESRDRQNLLGTVTANLYHALQQATGCPLPFELPMELFEPPNFMQQERTPHYPPPPQLPGYYFPHRPSFATSCGSSLDGLGISALPPSPITPLSFHSQTVPDMHMT